MGASDFYDQVNQDYLNWSKNLNIHFGYLHWPNIFHLFFLQKMLGEMNAQVMQRLGISENEPAKILDVGCGIGATCFQMSTALRKATFQGINISKKQIETGEKILKKDSQYKRIKLLHCDFTKVPLNGASIDAAFAIESACYDKGFEKKGFIQEMSRLIKSDGRLVVADGFRKHKKKLPLWLEKLHRQNLDYWSMDELADIQSFTNELKKAGFEILEVNDVSWNVAPSALHLPITALKVFFNRFFSKNKSLSEHQRNYPKAIWLTLFLGLFQQHFGYYFIVGKKK